MTTRMSPGEALALALTQALGRALDREDGADIERLRGHARPTGPVPPGASRTMDTVGNETEAEADLPEAAGGRR